MATTRKQAPDEKKIRAVDALLDLLVGREQNDLCRVRDAKARLAREGLSVREVRRGK